MRNPWHTMTALWELLVLLARTGFRRRGKYWSWRRETAFGTDRSRMPSSAQQREAILDYGRWVNRMKRLR